MKCKKHPYELGAGVCASCLRERLLAIVAAEKELSPHRHPWGFEEPTIAFPRSVSPYLPHPRSVGSDASHHHDPSFFSTPGLGHTLDGDFDGGRNRRSGRFSVLKMFFGHHTSEKGEADWVPRKGSGRRSWFSALGRLRRRRKKQQPEPFSAAVGEAAPEQGRRPCRLVQRGMSPAMEDEEEADASGYTSESSNGWRRPIPTLLRRISANSLHRHHQHQQQQQQRGGLGGVSGFTVCLSPLMRSGASGRRSQVSESAGVSGELRYPANSVSRDRRTATGCAPLGLDPSRSWKLADFGRFK
ncbi:transposon protein [Musa troglodytarum]|uniref:Transposon protein n=1 Tax=Musa troglodytarum TaxID=320322 RepID=A0A9E7KUB4_9LILI|nr:transposon protein [Musa troglodytarum]